MPRQRPALVAPSVEAPAAGGTAGSGRVERIFVGQAARRDRQQRLQTAVDLVRAIGPRLRVLGQEVEHEPLDHLRHVRAQVARRRRVPLQMRVHLRCRCGSGEDLLTGKQLVQYASQRIEVAARAGGARGELLGRHIGRAVHRLAGGGDASDLRVEQGGDPEVEDAHNPSATGDHDVARLEVAMHERDGVRSSEEGGDLGCDRNRPVDLRCSPAGEHIAEILAVDKLHGDVEHVGLGTDVEHSRHSRMLQARGQPRLASEPGHHGPTLRPRGDELGPQQLQSYATVQARVVGRPHLAHTAAPDGDTHL